jgi:parallel beta-helix repeat protein
MRHLRRAILVPALFIMAAVLHGQSVLAAPTEAPGSVVAAQNGSTPSYADVSWTNATSFPKPLAKYRAVSSPDAKSCESTQLVPLTCTVKGLSLGVSYTFTVQAKYNDGTYGPASNPSSPIVLMRAPDAPSNVSGKPGDGRVEVSWYKPKNNGGSTVTQYTAKSSPGGKTCSTSGETVTRCVVQGLTNGTAYTFSVVAHNLAGDSPASLPSAAVMPLNTVYVDGKNGNDANNGACNAEAAGPTCGPVKTIRRASQLVPPALAAGWKVIVRGYTDYVYRMDRIDQGFGSHGSTEQPIVFAAEGWTAPGSTGFTRPIVDGSLNAPLAGKYWHHASGDPANLWWTDWSGKPAGWAATSAFGDGSSAVFQDSPGTTTRFLWDQKTLNALRTNAAKGGYFWDGSLDRLYVAVLGDTSAAKHTLNVVMDNTMFFKGEQGVHDVVVAGFRVRHSDFGVAFVGGMDRGAAYDNLLEANLYAGIHTVGRMVGTTPDPSTGDTIMYNTARYSTVQGIKISFGSQNTLVKNNVVEANALQGIKVQGTPPGGSYTGTTDGIQVLSNTMRDQTCLHPDCGTNDNSTGISIANSARNVLVRSNKITANGSGIRLVTEGSGVQPLANITLTLNRVWNNRRYGINLYDGAYGAAAGAGNMLSSHNLVWGNLVGVFVDKNSSNKAFQYETIFDNETGGLTVNGRYVGGTDVILSNSLVTNNSGVGVLVSKEGTLDLEYCGVSGNTANVKVDKGHLTQANVNSQPAGYLSTLSSSAQFLMIDASSYQYTAGPGGTPIGAKF